MNNDLPFDPTQPISWQQLKTYLESQLQRARERNDVIGAPDAETHALRGEIRLLKRLLDLPEQAARIRAMPQT